MQNTTTQPMANIPLLVFLDGLTLVGLRRLAHTEVVRGKNVSVAGISKWRKGELICLAYENLPDADITELYHKYRPYLKHDPSKYSLLSNPNPSL